MSVPYLTLVLPNGTKLSVFGHLGSWLKLSFHWKFRSFHWQPSCSICHDFLNLVPLLVLPRQSIVGTTYFWEQIAAGQAVQIECGTVAFTGTDYEVKWEMPGQEVPVTHWKL